MGSAAAAIGQRVIKLKALRNKFSTIANFCTHKTLILKNILINFKIS